MRHLLLTQRHALGFSAIAIALASAAAHASSDDAWEAQRQDLVAQCEDASQFPDAAPAGEPVIFDDEAGMTALLIQGHYPQAHMNGQAGQELCLYLRASQEVYIADADKLAIGSDALPSTPTDAMNASPDAAAAASDDTPASP
ncbi:hypothetical protein [Salinicola rhizosphaerae]|uniref:Uncharacterized protein n=1 Tax=Salinicola rhizosphaerae TaxID=1443141 RepID=A0ABQ3EH86_9GAMM|nr:hypothetical protein [Salinicola rhizosphaerae]GHB32306.1 hypothetical protein GCM10009038_33860 [Salinicola rhizosphaerae]